MENIDYNEMISNNQLEKLANIRNVGDLVQYFYRDRALIEYLLEKNIHTNIMDNMVKYHSEWVNYYLKYGILKPLLNCQLEPLLLKDNGKMLLEQLLDKLDNDDRWNLYHNLKTNSYWLMRKYEKDIIELYAKYDIHLPQIFIHHPVIADKKYKLLKHNANIIEAFKNAFSDHDKKVIDIYINEITKRLSINYDRTCSDINKLINYKEKHPEFKLKISKDTEGLYDGLTHEIKVSPHREQIMWHELSHLFYEEFDYSDHEAIIIAYKEIQNTINNETKQRIINYLHDFHRRYDDMRQIFEEMYYYMIRKKYQSYDKYIQVVCEDIKKNSPEAIFIDDAIDTTIYVNGFDIVDVVSELLIIEKEEYINNSIRNYYTEELMLENLLDALLMGEICDGLLGIACYSGHSYLDFIEDDELSFNECLANYDAIINSNKKSFLVSKLSDLIGDDIVNLLDNYLTKNRGVHYGNRS